MGRADYYKRGSWNSICDICGFKRKAGDLRRTWDGYMACRSECWYPRNPQDFVRGVMDRQKVAWTRPDVTPQFEAPLFSFSRAMGGSSMSYFSVG